MITHCSLYILYRQFTIRLDIEWHRFFRRITFDEIRVLIHRLVILAEERPDTGFTATQCTEIVRTISLSKTEFIVFSFEIALLSCKRNYIWRIKTILLVIKRNLLNARLIGMCCNAIVWNTDSYPNCTFVANPFTDHFHDPSLVLIRNGKGFSTTIIAIFFHQICHDLNGLSSSLRTLQRHIDQTSIIHDASRIDQFMPSSKRTLRNGQLMFIHISHYRISMCHLWNLSQWFTRVPLDNVKHRSGCPVSRWPTVQFTIQTVRIGCITDHHRTIYRRLLSYQQSSTSHSFHTRQQGCTGSCQNPSLHILPYYIHYAMTTFLSTPSLQLGNLVRPY